MDARIHMPAYTRIFTRVGHAGLDQLRLFLFLGALGVYALAGSPTPDNPGIPEILIGVLLVLAAGLPAAANALRVEPRAPLWRGVGSVLLIYGLSIGVVVGSARGAAGALMLRDMIPFLFLLLPLFLMPLVNEKNYGAVVAGVIGVGVIFSIRALVTPQEALNYFANMPSVLFAGLFLAGWGGEKFIREFTPRAFVIFVFCAVLAVVTFMPVAITMQRASLGYAAIYCVVLTGLALFYYPKRMAAILIVAALAIIAAAGALAEITQALAQKTSLVGFNARFEELAAVWREIARSPATLLLGTGWGGTFESPAVAEIRVNYTHSLLTSSLLKLGVAGLILVILYIGGVLRALAGFLRISPVLALALAGPILIDVFLYASFKSLDFGLVLLLACGVGRMRAKVA